MDNDRLDRLENKIDKILDHTSSVDITLARLTGSVEEHVRRSNLLEESLNLLKLDVDDSKTNWSVVIGVIKIISFLAVVCGAFEGIVALLTYVRLK